MLQNSYSFEELKLSSQLVRDLIAKDLKTKPLLNQFFALDNVPSQIEQKTFSLEQRETLVRALEAQNKNLKLSEKTSSNIQLLREENTFTVTTGHQLNLLTGPLYMLYKLAQCIGLANELNMKYPEYNFVPIFWMATEDHDFEEINSINLFGQKHSWDKTRQEKCIAGRIETEGIEAFLKGIEEKFQDPAALENIRKFTDIYRDSKNLAESSRRLINELFGEQGLVIIDGDDRELKQEFKAIMKKELEEEVGFTEVMKTNEYLAENNYHEQVFVRHSNLFFINDDGTRLRIKKEEGQVYLEDNATNLQDLLDELDQHPERFSPNALYRPLYQESILPNLVYLGGGGEIAYWLQLKSLFAAHAITYPMILTRDSVLLYSENQSQLLAKNELSLMDVKLGVDQIIKEIAVNEGDVDLKLDEAVDEVNEAKRIVQTKVDEVNPGLSGMVEAEFVKFTKVIEKIESKLIKAEKSKHEQLQKKLVKLRESFFPNNGFQERHENFIPYYLKDEEFLQKLFNTLKSFDTTQVHTVQV